MTDSRHRFESWFANYLVHHPILTSVVRVLPGLSLHDLAATLAEESWEAAQRVAPVVLAPEPTRQPVAPKAIVDRRGGWRWTPEARAAQAERMRQRWKDGKGAPFRPTLDDGELAAVAARAKRTSS